MSKAKVLSRRSFIPLNLANNKDFGSKPRPKKPTETSFFYLANCGLWGKIRYKLIKYKMALERSGIFMKTKKLDDKGFSLIEMITVMAILAVIFVVGVPSYNSFRAKAIQKEGFDLLNSFHTMAQSTRTEYDIFPGNLVATGFRPVGKLVYRLQSNDNANDIVGLAPSFNDNTCQNTSDTCNCGGNCLGFKIWIPEGQGIIGSTVGWHDVALGGCPMGALDTDDDDYIVGIAAVINTRSANPDRYYMDSRKVIEMCSDGLK